MGKRNFIKLFLILVMSFSARQVLAVSMPLGQAPPVTIAEASVDTISGALTCSKYKVVGICHWIKISWSGIKYRFSFMVQHKVPDTWVEVFNSSLVPASGPLMGGPSQAVVAAIRSDMPSGSVRTSRSGDMNDSVSRQDAMVIGNPANLAYSLAVAAPLSLIGYCHSSTIPYVPYYHSYLDVPYWHFEGPVDSWAAQTYSMLPGVSLRNVGGPPGVKSYGAVFPRTGMMAQSSPFKMGALLATRAVSITADFLNPGVLGPHTALQQLPYSPGQYNVPQLQTEQNIEYQMLYPRSGMASSCTRFMATPADVSEGAFNLQNAGRAWGYVGWRPFKCCRRRGSLIGITNF